MASKHKQQKTLDSFAKSSEEPTSNPNPRDQQTQLQTCSSEPTKRVKSGLQFSELKADLFSCPQTASLAHCVSEDLHMGKGIAVAFKKQFKGVAELKAQGAKTGELAVLKRQDRFIYYLVTKPRYFHKPTYDTLTSSLQAMKSHCVSSGVTELCMPRLGCGLDRLRWERVVEIIHEMFADVDIRITVYYL